MDSERILPAEQRLNARLIEMGDETVEWLDGLLEASDYENILDVDVEFVSLRNIILFDELAEALENEFIDEAHPEAKVALYRAMFFAFQVAGQVQDIPTEVHAGPYIQYLRKQQEPFKELHADVSAYLKENPEIRFLLDYYHDELDEGRDRHAYTLLGAGLVFMLAERSQGDRFLFDSAEDIEPDNPYSRER